MTPRAAIRSIASARTPRTGLLHRLQPATGSRSGGPRPTAFRRSCSPRARARWPVGVRLRRSTSAAPLFDAAACKLNGFGLGRTSTHDLSRRSRIGGVAAAINTNGQTIGQRLNLGGEFISQHMARHRQNNRLFHLAPISKIADEINGGAHRSVRLPDAGCDADSKHRGGRRIIWVLVAGNRVVGDGPRPSLEGHINFVPGILDSSTRRGAGRRPPRRGPHFRQLDR